MQKLKRNIAVDFDDVVAGFNEAYIPHHNTEYVSPPMLYETAHTYDLTELYGVDMPTMIQRIRRFCHDFHSEIKPHDGADAALEKLKERYELHIVTSRCETLTNITTEWLREFDLLKHFTGLHFTNSFGTAHPERTRSKLEVCRAIEAVALLEDAPGNALAVAEGDIRVLMPQRPWNKNVRHNLVRHYQHWEEVPGLV